MRDGKHNALRHLHVVIDHQAELLWVLMLASNSRRKWSQTDFLSASYSVIHILKMSLKAGNEACKTDSSSLGRPPDPTLVVSGCCLPIYEGMWEVCLWCQVVAVGNKMLNIILFYLD